MHTRLCLGWTCAWLAAHAPAAYADLVLRGPMEDVVLSGDRVAAVQPAGISILGLDRRVLARLGEAPVDAPQPRARPEQRERILDLHEVPESERDSDAAEDLVEDELLLRDRRRAPTPEAPPWRPAVAGDGGGGFWILAGDTLSHVDREGTRRPLVRLPAARAVAASGTTVLVAAALEILASTDGGGSFDTLAALTAPATSLVAAPSWAAWATADGVSVMRADGTASTWPRPRTRALAACGDRLVALTADGVYVANVARSSSLVRGGPPPAAGRLTCGADTPWIATAPALLASTDQAQSWRALRAPALPVRAAVVSADGTLWIATAAGLFAGEGQGTLVTVEGLTRPPRWWGLLPRFSVAAAGAHLVGRREQRLWLIADFPLAERPPSPVAVRRWAQADAPTVTLAPAPDPDMPCLQRARARAVALALAEPERARSYVRRAGRAAWLPELRLRVERRVGRDESLELSGIDLAAGGPLGLDTTNDIRYEARATWDLGRLVFSPDEVAAQTQALRMADMRREIESLLHRLYFERRRLVVARDTSDTAGALRVEELTAELDALSAGIFSACLRPGFEVETP